MAQEIPGGLARNFFMRFDEGERRRSIDRDDEIELALSGPDLRDVDMEIADRIDPEFALRRGLAFDLG
jgi:hypothetical protein